MRILEIISLCLTIAIFSLTVRATPYVGSPTVKRRAFVSAGLTCYYQCSEIEGYTYRSRTDLSDRDHSMCNYRDPGGRLAYCVYNNDDGRFTGFGGTMVREDCPQRAPEGGCGVQSDREFRKRQHNLGRARDEKAITDRQYKYGSKAKRNSANQIRPE